MHDHLAVGTRVRLTHAVDRYPHFIAPEGATGVVTESSDELVAVRLDLNVEGAHEWDNEVHWSNDDLGTDAGSAVNEDLEVIEPEAEGYDHAKPEPRCLQHGPDCRGKVEHHLNPDRDDFKTFARCEHHQAKRLESAEEGRRKYPTLPPSDFDPAYAGERWDEDA